MKTQLPADSDTCRGTQHFVTVNHCCNSPSIHPKCRQGTRSLASPAPSSASEGAGEARLPGGEAKSCIN